jgi:hypothetical protein
VIILGVINNLAFAQGAGEPVGGAADLQSWVDSLFDASRALVAVVAVVMIIVSGIVYALDLGGGKQIGLAKDMIMSTISGVLLFILASWLLNEVGGSGGLFPRQDSPATNPALPGAAGELSPGGTTPEELPPAPPPESDPYEPLVPGMPEQPPTIPPLIPPKL